MNIQKCDDQMGNCPTGAEEPANFLQPTKKEKKHPKKKKFNLPMPLKGYNSYHQMVETASHPDPTIRIDFWKNVATQLLTWSSSDFTNVIGEIGNPNSFWFAGGKLNVCYNCIDRHLEEKGDQAALIYAGNEPSDILTITYSELSVQVNKFANVLKFLGVKKGDVVALYLPVSVAAIVSMLACARIGAIHDFIFSAFRGEALLYRISDAKAKLVVTMKEYSRGSKPIQMKKVFDEVNSSLNLKVIVWGAKENDQFLSAEGLMKDASSECDCVEISAEDPLFILYTSGSTGSPKGIIHRAGGYSVAAALTHRFVFDIKDGDRFGCTSDLGWITGHSYVCYGPLLNGISTLIFNGFPLYPKADRIWDLIKTHELTHFYTSPSAARAIAAELPGGSDIEIPTLRIIGSVGETLDPETFDFLFKHLGKKKCWVVDTYWQTEMGSIIATSVPGFKKMKPGFIGHPLFGTELTLVDPHDHNQRITEGEGLLCISSPWPGLANAAFGKTDFSSYLTPENRFKTGDLAVIDSDGYIKIVGRTDDQLCVNGHRIGPAEVEAVLISDENVKEAAVVGIPHPKTGQKIIAFVVLNQEIPNIANELKILVSTKFSAIGRPESIFVVPDLPKTPSDKIIRVLLREMLVNPEPKIAMTVKNAECIPEILRIIHPE